MLPRETGACPHAFSGTLPQWQFLQVFQSATERKKKVH
jgi:hypothetical protein